MTITHLFHKPIVLKGLTAILWVASSVLALLALNSAADVVATIYAAFGGGGGLYGPLYRSAVALRQAVILPGSLLAVVVIIGGMEYHLRHFNTPGSWRLFAYVMGVETGILLLAVML